MKYLIEITLSFRKQEFVGGERLAAAVFAFRGRLDDILVEELTIELVVVLNIAQDEFHELLEGCLDWLFLFVVALAWLLEDHAIDQRVEEFFEL